MKRLILLIALILVFCSSSTIAAEIVPLPPSINIVQPGTDIPPEYTKFAGKWSGKWDNSCPLIIIVEEFDGLGHAKIIFAQGTWPWVGNNNPNRPFWERVRAQFSEGKMFFRRANGSLLYDAIVVDKDGSMKISRTDTRGNYAIDMGKLAKTE